MTATSLYEVELRELAYEADGDGVLRITGSIWRPIKVFRPNADPIPLTFESLDEVRAYAGQDRPGSVRIMRVTNEGVREVVDTPDT